MPYNQSVVEPTWCLFCEDQPANGRMILVYESTQNLVPLRKDPTPMPTCERCGVRHTGATAATKTNDGGVVSAVFQYEHPDYAAVADQARQLGAQLVCSVCGEPAACSEAAVTKFLRMWPHIAEDPDKFLKPVCGRCGDLGLCPCCGAKDCGHDRDDVARS